MKNLINKARTWFALRKADKELNQAIHKAWQLCEQNDRRYYVIPDADHKLRVLSWKEIKSLMHQGIFNRFVKESDFINESFYYTPKKVTDSPINPETERIKRNQWRNYYKHYRLP